MRYSYEFFMLAALMVTFTIISLLLMELACVIGFPKKGWLMVVEYEVWSFAFSFITAGTLALLMGFRR